jgi:hypothetical protein
MTVNSAALGPYLPDVEIVVAGRRLLRNASLPV